MITQKRVLVQRFYKVKDHRISTRISSYNPHNFVYKLNLRRDSMKFTEPKKDSDPNESC